MAKAATADPAAPARRWPTLVAALAVMFVLGAPGCRRDGGRAPATPVENKTGPLPEPPLHDDGEVVAAAPVTNHPLSPGILTISHQHLDDPQRCRTCHDDKGAVVSTLCLACHQPLATSVASGLGYHSTPTVVGRPCNSCHGEHRGRSYDLMGWKTVAGGQRGFDHVVIGWTIPRAYAAWSCAACHPRINRQGLRTFRGAMRSMYP